MPGGLHEHMKAWEPHEDRRIIELLSALGPRWSKIAKALPGRTISSIRNRWQRIDKGRKLVEAGLESKNRCNVCGQPKRGHVCFEKLRQEAQRERRENDETLAAVLPDIDEADFAGALRPSRHASTDSASMHMTAGDLSSLLGPGGDEGPDALLPAGWALPEAADARFNFEAYAEEEDVCAPCPPPAKRARLSSAPSPALDEAPQFAPSAPAPALLAPAPAPPPAPLSVSLLADEEGLPIICRIPSGDRVARELGFSSIPGSPRRSLAPEDNSIAGVTPLDGSHILFPSRNNSTTLADTTDLLGPMRMPSMPPAVLSPCPSPRALPSPPPPRPLRGLSAAFPAAHHLQDPMDMARHGGSPLATRKPFCAGPAMGMSVGSRLAAPPMTAPPMAAATPMPPHSSHPTVRHPPHATTHPAHRMPAAMGMPMSIPHSMALPMPPTAMPPSAPAPMLAAAPATASMAPAPMPPAAHGSFMPHATAVPHSATPYGQAYFQPPVTLVPQVSQGVPFAPTPSASMAYPVVYANGNNGGGNPLLGHSRSRLGKRGWS